MSPTIEWHLIYTHYGFIHQSSILCFELSPLMGHYNDNETWRIKNIIILTPECPDKELLIDIWCWNSSILYLLIILTKAQSYAWCSVTHQAFGKHVHDSHVKNKLCGCSHHFSGNPTEIMMSKPLILEISCHDTRLLKFSRDNEEKWAITKYCLLYVPAYYNWVMLHWLSTHPKPCLLTLNQWFSNSKT